MVKQIKKILKKLQPESVKYRLILVFSISMISIFTVVFIRNFNFTINGYTEKYLYELSNRATLNLLSIKGIINEAIITAKELTKDIENVQFIPINKRREFLNTRFEKTLEGNEKLLGVWAVMKPYSIDTLDSKFEDRFIGYKGNYWAAYYRRIYKIFQDTFSPQYQQLLNTYIEYFEKTKETFVIQAPIKVNYPVSKERFKISVIFPVRKNNNIIGIVGVDIPLSYFDKIYRKQFPDAQIFIIDPKDIIIYHTNLSYIGLNLRNVYLNLKQLQFVTFHNKIIESQNLYKFIIQEFGGRKYYTYYTTFEIPNTTMSWLFATSIPYEEAKKAGLKQSLSFAIAYILIVAFILSVAFIIGNFLDTNIKLVKQKLDEFSLGKFELVDLRDNLTAQNKDFKILVEKINKIINHLIEATNFARELMKENYNYEFKPASEHDQLGYALLELKDTLYKSKLEEQKRIEQQKIEAWHNKAITKINDILRQYPETEKFAPEALKFVVEYIDAIQGGFFVVKEDEAEEKKYLELISFYSYNREVYHRKKVDIGEGLVGSVALERKSLYTNVPDDYIEITSGMGKAKPNYLFIVPFIYENEVYGILEITSLNEIDEIKRKLVEEIARIISAELSAAKIAEQTQKLLKETQKSAELLKEKEKILKELTQKLNSIEAETKEKDERFRSYINALNEFAFVAEFDKYYNAVFVNKKLVDTLGITYSDALSSDYFILFQITDYIKHQEYLDKAFKGENVLYDFSIAIYKKEKVYIKTVLVPIYNLDGKIDRILFLGIDNTEVHKKETKIQELIVQLSELQEQTDIQNIEIETISAEYQTALEELEDKTQKVEQLEQEKEKLNNSLEFFKKELEKRIKRSKRIEQNLKQKNKELLSQIEQLQKEIAELKRKLNDKN